MLKSTKEPKVYCNANQDGPWTNILLFTYLSDVYNGTVTFLPLEENSEGKYQIKKCNIYQIQLTRIKDEEW